MQPRLLAISGLLTGTIHRLIDGELSIGRNETNGLRLDDPAVSRKHCRLECTNEQHFILDLGSRNGTFVNGVPVNRKAIAHGDTIRMAQSEFLFLIHEGEFDSQSRHSRNSLHLDLTDTISKETLTLAGVESRPVTSSFGIEVGRLARDLDALFKISSVINSIRDAELLQRELLRLIFEVIPAQTGVVILLQGNEENRDSLCFWNRDGGTSPFEIKREIAQRAIWEQSAVAATPSATVGITENILCAPLIAVERIIGVLYLASFADKEPFREDHIYFLESVSRIAAVALENVLALEALRTECGQLKRQLNPTIRLVGDSRQIAQLEQFIVRIAQSESTVLIRGESGTGKEVVARTIHQNSTRHDRPFVAINCAAIPETLLESELFGSEKGAFTGAAATRKGRLEAAGDGTLLLDEIGELPSPMQAKLLRVLQQREFERVGGTLTIPLRARVLAATNKDLQQAIKSGDFRQDLYYRLNVVSITVPPLREHREDIPLLALYFAAKYAERSKRPFKGISREARTILLAYDWPGNVRELENAIEHAIVLGLTDELLPEDLPTAIVDQQASALGARYYEALNEKKKELINAALLETKGNFPDAARVLGLHPKYLHRLVRNLGLRQTP